MPRDVGAEKKHGQEAARPLGQRSRAERESFQRDLLRHADWFPNLPRRGPVSLGAFTAAAGLG